VSDHISIIKSCPTALTIAGSDSGGQAGIQADLRTFTSLGIHGACVITAVTAQNQKQIRGIQGCSADIVKRQLEAVFEPGPVAAAKTGMLYSATCIRVVARFFREQSPRFLVVDPVMVSTSGTRLIGVLAEKVLMQELLPMADLVTPNVQEAEVLTGRRLRAPEDLRAAAREIHNRFGCAALVKGGHLRGVNEAADIFYDGTQELLLTAPFIRGLKLHGTGCTYSAAITAWLARGQSLAESVQRGKHYITNAIAAQPV